MSQLWGPLHVIPALRTSEAGKLKVQVQSGKFSDLVKLYLKINKIIFKKPGVTTQYKSSGIPILRNGKRKKTMSKK